MPLWCLLVIVLSLVRFFNNRCLSFHCGPSSSTSCVSGFWCTKHAIIIASFLMYLWIFVVSFRIMVLILTTTRRPFFRLAYNLRMLDWWYPLSMIRSIIVLTQWILSHPLFSGAYYLNRALMLHIPTNIYERMGWSKGLSEFQHGTVQSTMLEYQAELRFWGHKSGSLLPPGYF